MNTKPEHYYLKWNNYQSHVAELFVQLLQSESMVDVTLCAEGQRIYAHRIVLSACSPYFQEILSNAEDTHPIVILSEMSSEDIKSIIEFVYRGELNVTADRFTSVLKAAEELHIRGLMEVSSHLPSIDSEQVEEQQIENGESLEQNLEMIQVKPPDTVDIFVEADENFPILPDSSSRGAAQFLNSEQQEKQQDSKEVLLIAEKGEEEKKPKRRKETCKKDYSEAMLVAALEQLRAGRGLVETATAHCIPRSTLYVRARAQGVPLAITRQEHSGERVQAAVRAVTGGASLKQTADLFKIPKTVLWRRVQKEVGNNYTMNRRTRLKQTYGYEKKQAAIKALERGENLSKVSHQYQIPKTTLFREKTRLVEAGRLPWTCLRKRNQGLESFKQHQLSEAVAACKEGKMSQAVASLTFQVPKTTIWRRLQQGSRPEQNAVSERKSLKLVTGTSEGHTAVTRLQSQPQFSFPQVTYMDEASLIILTTDDGNGITIQEGGQLIVGTDSAVANSQEPQVQTIIHCNPGHPDNASLTA